MRHLHCPQHVLQRRLGGFHEVLRDDGGAARWLRVENFGFAVKCLGSRV